MLGSRFTKQLNFKDMESEDYGFYKGLEFLAENSVGVLFLS